jgi:hypothetical protein
MLGQLYQRARQNITAPAIGADAAARSDRAPAALPQRHRHDEFTSLRFEIDDPRKLALVAMDLQRHFVDPAISGLGTRSASFLS